MILYFEYKISFNNLKFIHYLSDKEFEQILKKIKLEEDDKSKTIIESEEVSDDAVSTNDFKRIFMALFNFVNLLYLY